MECALCKLLINKDGQILFKKGADSINKASVLREADIIVSEGQQVHVKCRREFVRDEYIPKKRKSTDEEEEGLSKRLTRSEIRFNIKTDCIF